MGTAPAAAVATTNGNDSSPTTENPTVLRQQQQQQTPKAYNDCDIKYYPSWHTAVAGGLAGLGSRLGTAPLDLIRIRRQLHRHHHPSLSLSSSSSIWTTGRTIVATEEGGIAALYRGNAAAMALWMGYAAVQFSVYQAAHAQIGRQLVLLLPLQQQQQQQQTIGSSNISQQHQPEASSLNTSESDCRRSPQTVESTLPPPTPPTAAAAVAFGAGAVAGVCATVATYPLDVCRTAFSARGLLVAAAAAADSTGVVAPPPTTNDWAQKKNTPKPPRTMIEFALQLHRQKGWTGFYAGVWPAVIQIIPYMGLNFALYDWFTSTSSSNNSSSSAYLTTISSNGKVDDDDDDDNTDSSSSSGSNTSTGPSVGLAAYAGSLSGAISKMCVYPLDTVKRRLQAQAFYSASLSSLCASSSLIPTAAASATAAAYAEHYYYRGMWDCIVSVYRHEGIASFYRGIVPSVLKTAIATSLTFSLFHWTNGVLQSMHDYPNKNTNHSNHD